MVLLNVVAIQFFIGWVVVVQGNWKQAWSSLVQDFPGQNEMT